MLAGFKWIVQSFYDPSLVLTLIGLMRFEGEGEKGLIMFILFLLAL